MFGWTATHRQMTNQMSDLSDAYDGTSTGTMSGIIAGTRVATSMGWCDADLLQPGDMVLTFDGGLQPVTGIRRMPLWSGAGDCPSAFWPLLIPAGALDNANPMRVLPHQSTMLESDVAEAVLGDPFALVPAAALEGLRGIVRAYPKEPVDVISLSFEADQVVFAEQGALLFCPAGGDLIQAALSEMEPQCAYNVVPENSAVHLVRGLQTHDAINTCLERFRETLRARTSEDQVAA